jgi:hypothetical protein
VTNLTGWSGVAAWPYFPDYRFPGLYVQVSWPEQYCESSLVPSCELC